MDAKAEIKARLPIEELVGQYCQLHRKGRNFTCLCPFHHDTHPSLLVSPDKGIAYCFACNTGGDIFSFYQSIESVDFPQALKDLAERTGVTLPREPKSFGPKKDEKDRLKECLLRAADFFERKLTENPVAQSYLLSRGVDEATRAKFRIGYAPDSFSETYDELLRGGFSKNEMIAAGLAVQRDLKDDAAYDRFRHRLMFPIEDHQGSIIGFGGRALRDEDAKYVNSPEGPLYHKSSVLYGLSLAREAARVSRSMLLVEGYFDVIAAHKAGVQNVVAVSGTAFTADHSRLLKRYADTAVLCLDQDRAGKEASARAFTILASAGIDVRAVAIAAKDPDEFVQKNADGFRAIVASGGAPYLDTVLADLQSAADIHSPSGKRAAIERLIPLLLALPAAVEREAYVARAAQMLGASASAIMADMRRIAAHEKKQAPDAATVMIDKTPFSRSELCIGLALTYPKLKSAFADLLPPDDEKLERVHGAVIASTGSEPTLKDMELDEELKQRVAVLLLFCEENFSAWSEATARREIRKLIAAANREIIATKQRMIIRKLHDARKDGRRDEELALLTQYNQALKLMKMAS